MSDPTKELKRTAHILHTTVDRLQNARAALKEATDLARHSSDNSALDQLTQDWMRIDKTRAPAALEDLYGWLKTTARDAPDATSYQHCMSGAQSLLRQLATLDSEKAVSLWRTWPDPPAALGQDLAKMREQALEFEKQLAAGASGDLMMQYQRAAKGDYAAAGNLAVRLSGSGDWAEALKLVDQAMANFGQGPKDPPAISSYVNFLRSLTFIDPDRSVQALRALMPLLSKLTGPNIGGTLTVGNQTLQLTAAEAAAIDLCHNAAGNGYPNLAMKALDAVPGLKNKLNSVGGIDNVNGSGSLSNPSRSHVSFSYSIDGQNKTVNGGNGGYVFSNSADYGPAYQPANLLYVSLRYKLTKDPAFVKKTLADAAKSPDQIDVLIRLANMAISTDPDLASLALEFASKLVMQVEPLSKRATVIQQLIQQYQQCDGDVDASLLEEGLVMVQQLRDEQNSAATPMPPVPAPVPSRGTVADRLEMAIVAERSLDNFDGAMKYVRLMQDNLKLPCLLQIVQTLTHRL